MANITTIIGPMWSGKTSELIRLVDRRRIAKDNCLIIKFEGDNRYDTDNKNHVTSHSQHIYTKCDIQYFKELTDNQINDFITSKKYNTIAIEEGHFFKDIAQQCHVLANNNINVIVSALDSSFEQKLFTNIGDLIALSENVIKLHAVCMRCSANNASFTIRTIDNKDPLIVGGEDIYQSVCRKCLLQHHF